MPRIFQRVWNYEAVIEEPLENRDRCGGGSCVHNRGGRDVLACSPCLQSFEFVRNYFRSCRIADDGSRQNFQPAEEMTCLVSERCGCRVRRLIRSVHSYRAIRNDQAVLRSASGRSPRREPYGYFRIYIVIAVRRIENQSIRRLKAVS